MTSDPDAAQKEWLAGVFDRAAPNYDRIGDAYHDHFGARLAETAGIHPGACVLDVACGRGAVLLPAAVRAGAGGRVVGVDLSPEMIRTAGEALARVDLAATTELQVMDAERLEFDEDLFDFVLCSFGLFFFPRPRGRRLSSCGVLVPGGVVAVSSWTGEDDRWDWEDDLLAGLDVSRRAISRPFDRLEDLEQLLVDAGFVDVTGHVEQRDIHFATEDQWWDWMWSVASVAFSSNSTLHPSRPSARPRSAGCNRYASPPASPCD